MVANVFHATDGDFRILQRLLVGDENFFHNAPATYDQIGKALEMHPNTVSARVRKLAQARWFMPFSILPNCNRLGFTGGRLFLPLALTRRPRGMIETLFRVEGVYCLAEYAEGWEVILFADDRAALDTKALLVRDLLRAQEFSWEVQFDRDWPTGTTYPLSRLEAKILASLAEDARRSPQAMADELGVTARTVQLRLQRLRNEAMFHVYLAGEVATSGMAMAYLCAEFDDADKGRRATPALKELLPNRFTHVIVPHRQRYYLWDSSVERLAEQADSALALDGVRNVQFRVLQKYHWNPQYPKWLATRLNAN